MKYPDKLKAGATIGVVCPSSAITKEQRKKCREVLEKQGFRVKLADNLCDDYGGYMAGSGEKRADWINRMFADPEVDAIFCARGGDGGTRDYEGLNLDLIRQHPKIFVGYSDITTFHLLFNQECGFVTFHGPMVSANMINDYDEDTRRAFENALEAEDTYEFQNPAEEEIKVLKPGKASGILTGGNLALLSASMGTPYEVDTRGKILFIEEVGENPGRLERFVWHLRMSGKLKDAKGILLGQFTDCENKTHPDYNAIALFRDALQPYSIPVLYDLQSGHGKKIITLPMGALCHMDTETKKIIFKVDRNSR